VVSECRASGATRRFGAGGVTQRRFVYVSPSKMTKRSQPMRKMGRHMRLSSMLFWSTAWTFGPKSTKGRRFAQMKGIVPRFGP
jgi:hypothetical protein